MAIRLFKNSSNICALSNQQFCSAIMHSVVLLFQLSELKFCRRWVFYRIEYNRSQCQCITCKIWVTHFTAITQTRHDLLPLLRHLTSRTNTEYPQSVLRTLYVELLLKPLWRQILNFLMVSAQKCSHYVKGVELKIHFIW